jgi:hypothetical protein
MIGAHPRALVCRVGITPLQQNSLLREHHEEGGAKREHVEALEIGTEQVALPLRALS